MLTEKYYKALELAKSHHASSNTYSGKLMRPHAPIIKELIDRHSSKTMLDYGCGKGGQYLWVSNGDRASIPAGKTIGEYLEVDISLYDPAYPPFATEPVGKFDIVVCTHVLGSIPLTDFDTIVRRIYGLANKAVYVAEKVGEVGKGVFTELSGMPRFSEEQWESALRAVPHDGLEVVLSTRVKTENGVETKRRAL